MTRLSSIESKRRAHETSPGQALFNLLALVDTRREMIGLLRAMPMALVQLLGKKTPS